MSKLFIGFGDLGQDNLQEKYPEKFKHILNRDYKIFESGKLNNSELIRYLQDISKCMSMYDIVYTEYDANVVYCLDNLNTSYTLVFNINDKTKINIDLSNKSVLQILDNSTFENELSKEYSWIRPESNKLPTVTNKKITLQNIMNDDVVITEQDIRDIKEVETKIKVALLLQAKRTLNRTLKLLDVLDVLCDNLVTRISDSVNVADTASLMTTVQFISNSINEANKFVYTLISNDKIQNFFIVDNSNVINITDDKISRDKREKVRKVIEIVLDNIDNFSNGNFDKLQEPNSITEVDNSDSVPPNSV